MNVFWLEGNLWFAIFVVLVVVKGFALVSALLYPAQAYEATDKLTKPGWAMITGLGFAAQLMPFLGVLSIINIIFTVAAFVYLADVRPALREVTSRR